MTSPRRYLTRVQAARYLGIPERTVSEFSRRNEIPVIRVNRRILRYCREDLDRWMAERTEGRPAG